MSFLYDELRYFYIQYRVFIYIYKSVCPYVILECTLQADKTNKTETRYNLINNNDSIINNNNILHFNNGNQTNPAFNIKQIPKRVTLKRETCTSNKLGVYSVLKFDDIPIPIQDAGRIKNLYALTVPEITVPTKYHVGQFLKLFTYSSLMDQAIAKGT